MGPKAGDYVEYEGVVRRVMCACDDPGADHFRAANNQDTLVFFNHGEYADTCPECKDYFWFDSRAQYASLPEGDNVVVLPVPEHAADDNPLRIVSVQEEITVIVGDNDVKREMYLYGKEPTVSPVEANDNPLAALRDVLPDVYGRREHAAYMARQAEMQQRQTHESKYAALELLGDIMDKACGPARVDEPEEEPAQDTTAVPVDWIGNVWLRDKEACDYSRKLYHYALTAILNQNKRSFWGRVAS